MTAPTTGPCFKLSVVIPAEFQASLRIVAMTIVVLVLVAFGGEIHLASS